MKNNSNIKQAVPFFWVMDLELSITFYVDGLGFEIKDQWMDQGKLRWCWMENGGAAIMLQEFWKEGHHANLPTGKLGLGVSIAFVCENALDFYTEIKSRGIQATEPFVANHLWMTNLTDPDGYDLVFQSPTDVPEETQYSEWLKN